MANNPYKPSESVGVGSPLRNRKWGCLSHFFLFIFLLVLFNLGRFLGADPESQKASFTSTVVILLIFYGTGHTFLTWFRPRR